MITSVFHEQECFNSKIGRNSIYSFPNLKQNSILYYIFIASQVSGRHDGNMFSPAWYIYLLIPAASCLVVGLIISFFRFGLPKNTQSQSSRIISPLPTTIQYDEIADFENNVDVVQGLPREQSQYDKLCGTRTEAAYHEFSNVPGISKYSPCNYKQDMVVDKDNTLSQTVKLNVANHYEDVKWNNIFFSMNKHWIATIKYI